MEKKKTKILFVDDEKSLQNVFTRAMSDDDLIIDSVDDGLLAIERLKTFHADIVVTDVRMPNLDGFSLLNEIKLEYPDIFVVMVTGFGAVEDAVSAMKAGAYDYLLKPFDFEMMRLVINKIREHKRFSNGDYYKGQERRRKGRFKNIIGQDRKMFNIFQKISDVAATNSTVLITGESGTGKELVAEAIHYASNRKKKPLINVNCSALTDTLVNSELFGHEKGAFTDAKSQKKGFFELADGGTLFLDEIGDISIPAQLSLLRVIELGNFHRVGGVKPVKADARIICATNKDLNVAVKEKLFREDLFYRINVVSIQLPPLRERKTDIPLLANHFLTKYQGVMVDKQPVTGFSRKAINLLTAYDWPGNVRELSNVIENALVFCKKGEICTEDLPQKLHIPSQSATFSLTLETRSLPRAESLLVRRVLEDSGWNLKVAAKDLEIARGTLYSKMKKHNIFRPE